MKRITESENFIYYVEKNNDKPHFVIANKSDGNVILQLKLCSKYEKTFEKLFCIKSSPNKLADISENDKAEIKQTMLSKENYEFAISNYQRAIMLWNEENPDNEVYCETPEEEEGFLLTYFPQKNTGLKMGVNLRDCPNKNEKPFLRFQNDRNKKMNYNWIKMYLTGEIVNDENKEIVFNDTELTELKTWIKQNKTTITRHYFGDYDSYEAYQHIKELKK